MVFFGGIITSKSAFGAVAVCANTCLLIHSMVSPALTEVSAGEITRFSITIWMVAACAGTAIAASESRAAIGTSRLDSMAGSLLQGGGDVFGMLLMALK